MPIAETVTILSSDDEDEAKHEEQQMQQQEGTPGGSVVIKDGAALAHLSRRLRMEDAVSVTHLH